MALFVIAFLTASTRRESDWRLTEKSRTCSRIIFFRDQRHRNRRRTK